MKKFIVLLLIFIPSFTVNASENVCHGIKTSVVDEIGNSFKVDNRFTHCAEGDIISVYTKSLYSVDTNHTDLNSVAMRVNEVSGFCDFAKQIIHIGTTHNDHNPKSIINWFNCSYIGKMRDQKFTE